MNQEDFEAVIERQIEQIRDVLSSKNAAYNPQADKLRTFKRAASVLDSTPEQALWGMFIKHYISTFDMVQSDEFYLAEVWDEKLGDMINYLILLRALVFEKNPTEPAKSPTQVTFPGITTP